MRAGISSDSNSSRRSGIGQNVRCCVARLPSKGARGCHHAVGFYQPPPPPPPPPPPDPPPPKPEEPDEAGSALAKASLMLATEDDTALLKLLPDQPPLLHLGSAVSSSDRKSTRLNSSHLGISYAVFCLKKKKNKNQQ